MLVEGGPAPALALTPVWAAAPVAGLVLEPTSAALLQGVAAAENDRRLAHERVAKEQDDAAAAAAEEGGGVDESLLDAFMSELKATEDDRRRQALGIDPDPNSHMDRLLQTNYKWRNLNPFEVLQLPTDASEDDVKRRYKQLSMILHPDKLRTERAVDAFQGARRVAGARGGGGGGGLKPERRQSPLLLSTTTTPPPLPPPLDAQR